MSTYDRIEGRFHFRPPEEYQRFWMAGLLSNDRATGLRMSRFFWLSPDEIADCSWPSYRIASLVPFAQTPGRDHICWFVEANNDSWVADCPRDSDFAEGIAPNFEAFVFRAMLEEFEDSWISQNLGDAAAMFQIYTYRAASTMRSSWIEILAQFASRTPSLNRMNRPQVISKEEMSIVIAREIIFPSLNKPFRQNND